MPETSAPDTPAHEPDAIPVRRILVFTIAPAIAIAASLIFLFAWFVSDTDATPAAERWDARPSEGPRLQRRPTEIRDAIEARDAAWLSQGNGIEAAMAATAEAGWREGTGTPNRAYQARAIDEPAPPVRDLPREADLRETPAEPREAGDPQLGDTPSEPEYRRVDDAAPNEEDAP